MILSDKELREYLRKEFLMIEPLSLHQIRENGIDLTLGPETCKLNETEHPITVVDGSDLSGVYSCRHHEEYIELEPNTRYLLHTREYMMMPPDLMGFVQLRSTFARLGFIIPPTIIDAGFEGQITIEALTPPYPVRVPIGARFLHIVFAKATTPVKRPYRGKYQGQRGVQPPILKGIK